MQNRLGAVEVVPPNPTHSLKRVGYAASLHSIQRKNFVFNLFPFIQQIVLLSIFHILKKCHISTVCMAEWSFPLPHSQVVPGLQGSSHSNHTFSDDRMGFSFSQHSELKF